MAHLLAHPKTIRPSGIATLAALAASLLMGGCAGTSDLLPKAESLASAKSDADPNDSMAELRKATEYWGKQYESKPTDKTAALSYARNLKAMGKKKQALSVLQDASTIHGSDPEMAGELGRLALEFDQLSVASSALEAADVPDKPDWKVISARGTLLAKQGQHKAAIPFFERALVLAPNQPSVLNNLALATAMSGDARKAEEILRQVPQNANEQPKVNQNLALILGLQGKYDEARNTGSKAMAPDLAAANTDYVRRMVRLEPKASPVAAPAFATQVTKTPSAAAVASVPSAAPALKPATVEMSSNASPGWATSVASSADDNTALKGSKR